MNVSALSPGIVPQTSLTTLEHEAQPPIESVGNELPATVQTELTPSSEAIDLEDSQPNDSQPYFEQARLRIKSQLVAKQSENGNTSVRSKSSLKYEYELEAADGTRIKLKAKLRLNSSYQEQGDTLKIKASLKFHLSAVQSSVEGGFGELFGSDTLDDSQPSDLSSLLQEFRNTLADIANEFIQADTLQGDKLIGDVVGAFNTLTETAKALLLGTEEEQIGASPNTPQLTEVNSPSGSEVASLPEETIENIVIGTADQTGVENTAELPENPGALERQETDSETGQLQLSILTKVRLSFKLSMTQLISAFDIPELNSLDSEDDSGLVESTSRFEAKISAYSNLRMRYEESQRPLIDRSA
ncbi:MAG: hypothetical protein O7F71_21110 [Gammaproteobacteria bacterium]|nr:hypothetical protein [Gammaproteobacteria bacterium]